MGGGRTGGEGEGIWDGGMGGEREMGAIWGKWGRLGGNGGGFGESVVIRGDGGGCEVKMAGMWENGVGLGGVRSKSGEMGGMGGV